ncbi:hypothetical protein KUTeg_000648 [Tegillarca granosa]|uniref:Uncharacterized protein n=1 Tax=Tegillarca granosa TaxID=220873 RepID=A0ABQ9FY40_TEGGR|nr:hypothetical protein KUTeg_000648 [Tegillarca granosa]
MASLLPKLTVIPKLEQLSERVIRVLGWIQSKIKNTTFCLSNVFFFSLAEKVRVSKFKRIASPDVNLGPNIPYTFINNNHVFKTEGATLRLLNSKAELPLENKGVHNSQIQSCTLKELVNK